ncbi:MAG: glycosyltransferase family 4 protein [Magnetovibrio sp.]|nr:glycosyltransferase family 4 protein [Magnetovibrio sp.]
MSIERLAISWQLSDTHGWGIFGLNLALNLIRHGPLRPLLLTEPSILDMPDDIIDEIRPYVTEQRNLMGQVEARGENIFSKQIAILHALHTGFKHLDVTDRVRGLVNIGFTFYERGAFDAEAVARANGYDRILAGSSWNRDYARAAGVERIEFVSQGVDTALFRPGPASGAYKGRFAIFSGGKLELRKGQDLVLAAFKIFHARHPDAVLVTSWRNAWPESALDVTASIHVDSAPETGADGELKITEWAAAHGVPADAFVDLGWLSNRIMPEVLRDMDCAVFPNRCEGGTNLVAMEAMATGVPCVLSANTGHLDIMRDGACYPLADQRVVTDVDGHAGMWRETQVEEIVERLEEIYTDRAEAGRRAEAGAKFMRDLSWENQTARLIGAIEDLF